MQTLLVTMSWGGPLQNVESKKDHSILNVEHYRPIYIRSHEGAFVKDESAPVGNAGKIEGGPAASAVHSRDTLCECMCIVKHFQIIR